MNTIENTTPIDNSLISREEMRALFFLTLQGKVAVSQAEEIKDQLKKQTTSVINFDKNQISFVNELA